MFYHFGQDLKFPKQSPRVPSFGSQIITTLEKLPANLHLCHVPKRYQWDYAFAYVDKRQVEQPHVSTQSNWLHWPRELSSISISNVQATPKFLRPIPATSAKSLAARNRWRRTRRTSRSTRRTPTRGPTPQTRAAKRWASNRRVFFFFFSKMSHPRPIFRFTHHIFWVTIFSQLIAHNAGNRK